MLSSCKWQVCAWHCGAKFTVRYDCPLVHMISGAHCFRELTFKHFTARMLSVAGCFVSVGLDFAVCHLRLQGWCHTLSLALGLMQDHKLSITPRNALNRISSSLSILRKGLRERLQTSKIWMFSSSFFSRRIDIEVWLWTTLLMGCGRVMIRLRVLGLSEPLFLIFISKQ